MLKAQKVSEIVHGRASRSRSRVIIDEGEIYSPCTHLAWRRDSESVPAEGTSPLAVLCRDGNLRVSFLSCAKVPEGFGAPP